MRVGNASHQTHQEIIESWHDATPNLTAPSQAHHEQRHPQYGELRKKPQKVIPRKSRKSAKSAKPAKSAKTLVPVPQDSNADIEKAIRKCLYGDTDILPSEAPEEPVPEIVDEEEEELEIVDDEDDE